jgi:CheY-like chemotaxis protein
MPQHGTILIAEDNDDDYFLVKLACHRAGVELPLFRVVDGLEAQDYLLGTGNFADRQKFPLPRIVIADLKMPRRNGMEFLQWMRAQPAFKRIPFIFLSASGHQSDIDRAYDLFANSYLVKPIRLDQLTDLLKEVKTYWLDMNRDPIVPSR